MAGTTVKEILLKWGVDTSSWKTAIRDISNLLEQQQDKAAKAQRDILTGIATQKSALRDLISVEQDLTAELQRQAQLRSQTRTDTSGPERVVHEKATTEHIRSQAGAHKSVQTAAEESARIAAEVTKQQKQIGEELKKQTIEVRSFVAAQRAVQTELSSTLRQEQLVTQEIKKQVVELQKLSQLRAPTAWRPTSVSPAPAPTRRGTPSVPAPAASVAGWQSEMAKLQGGIATGSIKAGSDEAIKAQKQIRDEIEKRMSLLRQIPNLSNAELAEVNKLKAAYGQLSRIMRPGKKEGNFLTEFLSGFSSRFAGTLAFAVFSAEGLGRIMETLTTKMKEFIESTGPLTQVREQFEKLATTQNVNPTKFIDDLRTATKGLVDDTTLYRTANQAMQSGLGTSSEKIIQLTQATVGLARANGRDAKEALQALDTFMTTGYARTLGRVTGLQAGALTGVRSLGGGFDQSTRLLLNFNEAAELVIKQYKAIGEPQLTYTERLKQMEEAQHRFFEELAIGLQQSRGFQEFLDYLGEAADTVNKWADKAGGWGSILGDAFTVAKEAMLGVKNVLSSLGDALLAQVKVWGALGNIITGAAGSSEDFSERFKTIKGAMFTVAEAVLYVSMVLQQLVQDLGLTLRVSAAFVNVKLSVTDMLHEMKQAWIDYSQNQDKIIASSKTELARLETLRLGGGKQKKYDIIFAAPDTRQTELQSLESEKRMAKVREELRLKSSEVILTIAQGQIKAEEELLQSQREAGLVADTDYYNKKAELENRRFDAVMSNLREEHAAKQEFNRADTAMDLLAAQVERAKAITEAQSEKASIAKQLKEQLAEIDASKNPVVAASTELADKVQEQTKATIANTAALRGEKAPSETPEGAKSLTEALFTTHPYELQDLSRPTAEKKPTAPVSFAAAQAGSFTDFVKNAPETSDAAAARITAKAKALDEQIEARKDVELKLTEAKRTAALSKQEIENKESLEKQAKAYQDHLSKQLANLDSELKAEQAARKTYTDAETDIDKHKIELQKVVLEEQFKDQLIPATTYLAKKKDLIEQEYQATLRAELRKKEDAGETRQAQATYDKDVLVAAQKRELDLTKLQHDQWEIRTGAEEKAFDNTQKLLDSQLTYQKQLTPLVGESVANAAQADTLRQIIDFKRQVLQLQEQEVQRLKDTNQEWFTQQERVIKTKEEMLKYNEELVHARAPLQGLSTIATNLSEGFGALRGKGMAGVSQALSQFASGITNIQKQAAERQLYAQAHGGGFFAQFGFGKQTAQTTPISAADREKALGGTLSNVDTDVKELSGQTKDLSTAVDGSKDAVKTWTDRVMDMSTTLQKVIDILNAKISDTASMARQPGESGAFLPRPSQGGPAPPPMATGGTVFAGGLAEIHAGEQVTQTSEVMAMVMALKAAASELTRFTTNLEGLTKALGKLGESPYAGQPRGSAPPAGVRAQDATTSVLKNIVSGVIGGGQTQQGGGSFLEKFFGSPRLPGQSTTQWWLGQKPKAAVSAGLSGPATAATPLGAPTKSDLGDADQILRSSDITAEDPHVAQNAAITQNIGVVTTSTQATSADTQATQQNTDGAQANTSVMGQMSGALSSATQIVGGFQNALSGAGGPGKSALAGAQAGFQLGSMIPGPAGAVVGGVAAGVGAIIGVFSGKAREQTEKISRELVAAFSANTTEVQNGTQTLQGGITSAQALITTTVSELTGQKGGKQILESVLPQMDQALNQLKQQQEQILQAFDQKLEIASSPIAYQDQLGQIQGIISQYQQYIQAGGSVANANQFLQQSFQTLAQNGINQLNQSEQDAINNALNYNDLLLQRQDLIQNTNLQIQQIMSQGVAVRQMPSGVTKAAQIQQVERQATEQEQNLDQEISVSKYKLDNEQQIYNLATTRVGLEQQLVLLQNQQTNLQLESTEALGNVVNAMKTALPTSMPAALAQLGLGAAYVPPEASEAPTPPIRTGINSVDIQAELQYQQALAYYQQQQNLPVGYINPAGSPAGTEQTGTAGNIYTGPTAGVPTTTPFPSTVGTTASQDQINQALQIIKNTQVGQPLNPEPNTNLPIGGGLSGPSPLISPSGPIADIVSTPDGNAMLVTATVGSFAAPTAAVRNISGTAGGAAPTPLPSNLSLYGTDASGNPVYSDTNGSLYSASGQSVGSIGAPTISDIKVYRPQPVPGGGGPPAGPITFPTPPGGGPQVIGPPPSLAPQVPGQGGVPGTGIQGVTVNPDGSLSFAQLPSTVLTTVNVGTAPGTTQNVGVVGTPPEVQAAITPTFSTLESVPIPTIVSPQPPPPAPITSGGQPAPPPGSPGAPAPPVILPQPIAPPATDVSALVVALNDAVSGDVNSEKVTMSDFIAILNNINSVGWQPTITQLQAFLNTFKKHTGPESRASQNVMQMAINQLQAMANEQPAPIAQLPAAPAPVTTAPTSRSVGTITGLPTFPRLPGGVITPTPIVGGGLSPYTASNTGGIISTLGGLLSSAPSAASGFLGSVASSFLPSATSSTSSIAATSANNVATLAATQQRVTLEQQINTLSSARVTAETQLVSLKMQEIQADMQRVAAHQNLLSQIKSAGTTASGNALEELMNGLYQTRSRQGFGGFTGEVSNPV